MANRIVLAVSCAMSPIHPGYVFKEQLLVNEKILSEDEKSSLWK
jgi:hypothetical protein